MERVPVKQLRCESSVIPHDNVTGEKVAQRTIAYPMWIAACQQAVASNTVRCNKRRHLYVRVAMRHSGREEVSQEAKKAEKKAAAWAAHPDHGRPSFLTGNSKLTSRIGQKDAESALLGL